METSAENTTISLATIIHDYAVYNTWANKQLVEWLRTKPVDVMNKEVASSFPSLQQTIVHIWDTQRFWQAVVQKTPPPPSFRMTGFSGTLEEAFEGIVTQSQDLENYIKTLSAKDLEEIVTFDTPWVSGAQAKFEFIHHCLTHSSYHRGQVVTIGHHVDLHDAPMTDYSFYLLRVKGSLGKAA